VIVTSFWTHHTLSFAYRSPIILTCYILFPVYIFSLISYEYKNTLDKIRQIKSRRMRWAGYVASKSFGGKAHLKDQGVDGRLGSK
jgi:hypothetical protein